MEILISGGTGFIGRPLVHRLVQAGHTVAVLSRKPDRAAKALPPEVKFLDWNGDAPKLPENLSAIVQLAGSGIAQWPWTKAKKNLLLHSRIETTRKILEAVARLENRPAVFVSASGMGFYGNTGNRDVHSGDPSGMDFLGRLASAWETGAFKARELGMRVAILRLGMVLGRGGGALPKMVFPYRLGLGATLGSGNQYWPWIHLEDAVEMFFQALVDPAYTGSYQAVAGEPVTQGEFSKILSSVLHRPRLFRIPEMFLRLGLGEMADLFLHGQRARNDGPGFKARYDSLQNAFDQVLPA